MKAEKMGFLQTNLDKLGVNIKIMKNVSAILFVFATAGERGQMVYESLKKVKGIVKDVDDKSLTTLYNNIFEVFISGVPHQQISPDDYFAFLERLGALLEEAAAQAGEADASLREMLELAQL